MLLNFASIENVPTHATYPSCSVNTLSPSRVHISKSMSLSYLGRHSIFATLNERPPQTPPRVLLVRGCMHQIGCEPRFLNEVVASAFRAERRSEKTQPRQHQHRAENTTRLSPLQTEGSAVKQHIRSCIGSAHPQVPHEEHLQATSFCGMSKNAWRSPSRHRALDCSALLRHLLTHAAHLPAVTS